MSGAGDFNIKIVGRGGHGSRPDQSINPIVTAAEVVAKLQTIVPLKISPNESAALSVTSISGGVGAWNIIPDDCTIVGGIRYFSVDNYKKITGQMRLIVDSITAINECKPVYLRFPELNNPVVNNPLLSKIAETAVDKVLPGARVEQEPWMASETYGRYQAVIPGIFTFVGIKNPALGSGAAHHNAKFDLDEDALAIGAKATLAFASEFLAG
jgi:amidohydrolase